MAIELGQASKPTRKQMQQKRVLERERRKAQNRANRTGESVRFGNETTTGMIGTLKKSPQAAAAPKPTGNPKPRANRAERQANRAERQAARTQQKQKRAVKTRNAIGSNDYRKSGTTLSTVDNRKKK